MTENKKNFSSNMGLVLGVIILIFGSIFLLDNLNIIDWDFHIWNFWPIILILVGLSKLFYPNSKRISFTGVFLIALGVLFLLDQLGQLSFDIGDLWPVVIILVGFNIIRHHSCRNKIKSNCHTTSNQNSKIKAHNLDKDFLNISSILGGGEYRFSNSNLKGGKITAIMGGGEIDLRDCSMDASQIEINVFILMGGYKLMIPKDWNLIIQASPLLGGIEHKTYSVEKPKKEIIVTGTIIMGGLEIRN